MSKVQLTTITPVHIGSGNVLHNNIDFVQGTIDDYSYLGIVDPKKLFDNIGPEHIDSWVAAIERGENIGEFIKKYAKNEISLEDYTSRQIYCPQSLHMAPNEEMRECIHNGFGKAYIPGSSIKGAIRTAVLTYLIQSQNTDVNKHVSFKEKQRGGKIVNTVKTDFEEKLFGENPNSDCFRFLQVGDAYFDEDCEDVLNMTNINVRTTKSFVDTSKHQLVEVITPNTSSQTFNLKIESSQVLNAMIQNYNSRVQNYNQNNPQRPKSLIKQFCVTNLTDLFHIINNHTKNLLDSEIIIWKDYIEEDGVRDYIKVLKSINTVIEKCSEKECILRVGHASGWRFITGAWTEDLNDGNWDNMVDIARPQNYKYQDMLFPKSRRINNEKDYDEQILGFVKLRIQ